MRRCARLSLAPRWSQENAPVTNQRPAFLAQKLTRC